MKEFVPAVWDDLAIAADKKARVPAKETVRLALRHHEVEIDLSADNLKALDDFLRPYLLAGTRIHGSAASAPAADGAPRKYNYGDGRTYGEHKEYLERLREWFASKGEPIGRKPDGTYAYLARHRREYAEHLRQQASAVTD